MKAMERSRPHDPATRLTLEAPLRPSATGLSGWMNVVLLITRLD